MSQSIKQIETREKLSDILKQDNATLVSPIDGDITSRTHINYLCGMCSKQHSKLLSNLIHGSGGALCLSCAKTRGTARYFARLNTNGKKSINNGETNFNRDLATITASKNGSTILSICCKEDDNSYTIIEDDHRITRDSYLHIMCHCGKEDYINFRIAYGASSMKPGEGLCLCTGCRKGHRSHALRETHRLKAMGESIISDAATSADPVESMPKRSARIEKEGQTCIHCKEHKPASEFFGKFNQTENCKVYVSICYACKRKRRTSNREDYLRNGSLEDFIRGEIVIAKDRTTKYNKKYPDKVRDFDITVPFLMDLLELQGNKCAISGLPMITTKHRDECPENERCNPNKMSIDRIDSCRGYTEDNVQLVRWRVNSMKMNTPYDKYKEEIRAQYEYLFGADSDAKS